MKKKIITIIMIILIPILFVMEIIGFHSNELIKRPIHYIIFLFLFISIVFCLSSVSLENKKDKLKEKNKKKSIKKILLIIFISLEFIGASSFLFIMYGPWKNFREWLISSAMMTMHHQYLATWFFSEEEIRKVLEANQLIEQPEETDPNQINNEIDFNPVVYKNEYEKEILTKENEDDVYKIIPISGKGYSGYLAVIYDSSRIFVETTKYLEDRGQYVTEMASQEKALLGINGGGFVDPNLNGSGGSPQGITIKNGKVITNRGYSISGGLIGFTEDNKLILGKMTLKEAQSKNIRDAVSFGPFLITNGKKAFIKGNGGWGTAPRTAIAQREDGIVLLLVVDGRTLKKPGADMVDLVEVLSNYGAYNAANLDGGTSSVMVLPEKEAEKYLSEEDMKTHCRKNYCHINDPIDSTGAHATRPVATSFLVK